MFTINDLYPADSILTMCYHGTVIHLMYHINLRLAVNAANSFGLNSHDHDDRSTRRSILKKLTANCVRYGVNTYLNGIFYEFSK